MQIFTYSLETLENLSVCIEIFRTQGEDLCTAVIREVKEETGVGDKKHNLWTLFEYDIYICVGLNMKQ